MSSFHHTTQYGIFSRAGFLTGTFWGSTPFIGNGLGFVAIADFAKVSKVIYNNKGIEEQLVGFGLSFPCFKRNPISLCQWGWSRSPPRAEWWDGASLWKPQLQHRM